MSVCDTPDTGGLPFPGTQIDYAEPEKLPPAVRYDLQSIAEYCSTGLTPQLMTGVVQRILQTHFSSASLIFRDTLTRALWSAEGTKMRIAPSTQFRQNDAGLYPAIIIKRGMHTSQRLTLGDRVNYSDQTKGVEDYARAIRGTMSLFCLAETDGYAEDLGNEVFDLFSWLSPKIRTTFNMLDFEVVELGEVGVLDEMGRQLGVPVTLSVAYEYGWTVTTYGPRFQKLAVTIEDTQ